MRPDRIKANGVHYTPPALADFLAAVTSDVLGDFSGTLAVLDPACGDGALLCAFVKCLPARVWKRVVLHGYEMDPEALRRAREVLSEAGVGDVRLVQGDFLSVQGVDAALGGRQLSLLDPDVGKSVVDHFDAVIANPPYVRTQVLGAAKAQRLAKRFGLSGRVDLYQAFAKAMASVLKPGGVLGLLTSNRFLTIRSGAALRRLLRSEFDLAGIYDLGDTKLFSAAVLPVIVVAKRCVQGKSSTTCLFDRVYACRSGEGITDAHAKFGSVLDAFKDRSISGVVATESGPFKIERGVLQAAKDDEVWSLITPDYQEWLGQVRERQACAFDDVAYIRVGIKTTADKVFIRDDWDLLPRNTRPEDAVLRPLITDSHAGRWVSSRHPRKWKVLYPHTVDAGKRTPIDLKDYPRTRAYLEAHKERLSRRKYVLEAGREWYEIWVPHDPSDWARPKIVFPDIAEEPRFVLDSTEAVVNGNCYWITLRPGYPLDWLFLILAVANSSFITKYYDLAFHNKLYAGRRRFMTQYVRRFPLPEISSSLSQKIIAFVRRLVEQRANPARQEWEAATDALVWESFGLVKEPAR